MYEARISRFFVAFLVRTYYHIGVTTRVDRISNFNHYRVYVTCDNQVTFSATMQGHSEPPPHEFIVELFKKSDIKQWLIEVKDEDLTEEDKGNKCLEIVLV